MKRSVKTLLVLLAAAFLSSSVPDTSLAADAPKERVVVMYFHRTQRCPTCLKMGSYTEEAVLAGFAEKVKQRKVAFHFIDFQDERNAAFTKAYGVAGPTLIVAKASGTKVVEYKNLKEMWGKVHDKDAFLDYVRSSVKGYLK